MTDAAPTPTTPAPAPTPAPTPAPHLGLQPASAEQQAIVAAFAQSNIIVAAVAGAGKTTTCLHIGNAYPQDQILLLTYNRALMDETKARVERLGLTNIEVRTLHSFCMSAYGSGRVDEDMQVVIDNDVDRRRAIDFARIIIDESQDIKPVLFGLIDKLLGDNDCAAPRICVLGDPRQMIYGFRGADARFLTMADQLGVAPAPAPWSRLSLATSFRVTTANAAFINTCMLHATVIKAVRKSIVKPLYLIANGFDKTVYKYVCGLLEKGVRPDEIMILAPSVRPPDVDKGLSCWSPVNKLIHWITERNIIARRTGLPEWPIARQDDDDNKSSAAALSGKILVSTMHGVKGCERPYVFVYSFDAGYFIHFDKKSDPTTCPNVLYVAVTRATRELILVHDKQYGHLPFLDVARLGEFTDIIGQLGKGAAASTPKPPKAKSVTRLTKFIPPEIITECLKLIMKRTLRKAATPLDIAVEAPAAAGREPVADITGTLLPIYYELKAAGGATILTKKSRIPMIEHLYASRNKKWMAEHKEFIAGLRKEPAQLATLDVLVRLCTLFKAYETDAPHRAHQITNYGWISPADCELTMARFTSLKIGANAVYERALSDSQLSICGYADCVDIENNILYEFKCVSQLTSCHMIQLALYALLWETSGNAPARYMLYNVKTDELIEIAVPLADLKKIAEHLKSNREMDAISDEAFIARHARVARTDTRADIRADADDDDDPIDYGCDSSSDDDAL